MKFRDIIGLVIALLLAIGVALLTRIFLTKEKKSVQEVVIQKKVELTKVLVAARPLLEGTRIMPGDLVWQEWPEKAVNSSYITEGTVDIESFIGNIVRFHLNKDEPVLIEDIVKQGEKGVLAALITPGKRAISIDITAQGASSGLISPGDSVDIILSKAATATAGNQLGESITVVKNVKVLAMDFETASVQGKPQSTPHVATIEVTPKEAETVTAAAKEGTLSMSLRSLALDSQPNGTKTAIDGSGQECEKALTPKPSQKMIVIIRGKDKTEIPVQEP